VREKDKDRENKKKMQTLWILEKKMSTYTAIQEAPHFRVVD
jgi:hypothetical protein